MQICEVSLTAAVGGAGRAVGPVDRVAMDGLALCVGVGVCRRGVESVARGRERVPREAGARE